MDHSSPRHDLHRQVTILEEMGFGSITDSGKKLNRRLTKRSSIGMSDFWSEHEKEKFLRDKGLWQTFKEIKKQEMIQEVNRNKVKHASLPRIIDINTIQKVNNNFKTFCKEGVSSRALKINVLSLSESPVKVDGQSSTRIFRINSVVNECNSLAKEMAKFRKETKCFGGSLGKKLRIGHKKKVSSQDLRQIKLAIKSIK